MIASEIMELAIERINALMDAEEGSPEAEELSALAAAVEAYEDKVYGDDPESG